MKGTGKEGGSENQNFLESIFEPLHSPFFP